MKQRLLSIILALFLVIETVPAYALTAETSVLPKEIECICVEACTEIIMNFDCPICGMEGAVPEVCGCAVFEPGEDEGDTFDDNAPVCICIRLCSEDAINADCPICGIEGASPEVCGCTVFEPGEDNGNTLADNVPVCICTQACTEDAINLDCPICGVDGATLDNCGYKTPITDSNNSSGDGNLVCICSLPCAEGEMNPDCPVCGVDEALPDVCSCCETSSDKASAEGEDISLQAQSNHVAYYGIERAGNGTKYDFAIPKVIDLRMSYIDGYTGTKKEISLYDNSIENIIVGSDEVPVFKVVFENGARVKNAYITSVKDSTKLYLEALRDEKNENLFVTNGAFNADASYIPKFINVEFTKKADDIVVTDNIDWDTIKTNILPPDDVTITESTDTATIATLEFKNFTEQPVVTAFINYFDNISDSNVGDLIGATNTLNSYFVKGVDGKKYWVYLDNDIQNCAMIVRDITGGEAVKIALESSKSLEDLSETINTVNTGAKLVYSSLAIEKEMSELRDEVKRSSMSTEEKEDAYERIDALENDKKAFSLLTTIIPAIVAAPGVIGASMSAAPALLFSGLLTAITSSADFFWEKRIGTIPTEAVSMEDVYMLHCIGSGQCGEHLTYRMFDNGVLIITGTGEMCIGYAGSVDWKNSKYFGKDDIEKVIINPGASNVQSWAFEGCSNLVDISIPNTVIEIGELAFSGCTSLKEVSIPESVQLVGEGAFKGCETLKTLELSDGILEIDGWAFFNCTSLDRVIIPSSVVSIGDNAFYNCKNLVAVSFASGIKEIGESAFSNCSNLSNISIPDSVTVLSDSAFSGCTNLRTVSLSNTLVNIGDRVFDGCSSLSSINIPESVVSIGNFAFNLCSGLSTATLPQGLNHIGNYAFNSCSNLTSIAIPNTVSHIGDFAFRFCEKLRNVILPNGIVDIGESAFWGCGSLSNVTIPGSITNISSRVFASCSNLTTVDILSGVTSIAPYAFWDCSSLNRINIPTSITTVDSSAFTNCASLKDVYYNGTKEQFDLFLSPYDFPAGAIIHYNSTLPESNVSINITSPAFDTVTYGYSTQPIAKAITITNTGSRDATISSVTVNGNNFTIGGSGSNVAAGASIDTWTIRPNMALNAGVHTATITVLYDNNKRATAGVTFTVNKAVPTIRAGVETLWAIENSQPLLEDVAISHNATSAAGVSSEALTGSWTWKTPKAALVATDSNPTQSFTAVFTPDSGNYATVETQLPVKITRVEAVIDGGFDIRVLPEIGKETLVESAITIIGAPLTDHTGNYTLDKIVTWSNLCENISIITTANTGTAYKATVKGIKPGITMVGIAVREKNVAYVLVQVQGDSTGNNASEVTTITEMLDGIMDTNNLTPTDKKAVSALVETVIKLSDAEKDKLTAEAVKTLDILAEKAKDLTIKVDTTPKDNNATKPQLVNIAGAAAASGAQAAEVVVEVKAITPTAGAKMELELSLKVDGQEQHLLSPLFFEITLPTGIDPARLTIKHVKDSGNESNVLFTTEEQTVKFKLLSFSSLRFLVTERPSGGNNNSDDDKSSYRDSEWEFWQDVSSKIEKASPGDIIKVNARGYDRMSWSVMEALRQKVGITLVITWNGGEDIVIPSSAALYDPLRIYWPLSYLAGYDFGTGAITNLNPETGGVWIVDAPATAEMSTDSTITDPSRGLADTPELAAQGVERTIPHTTELETIPSSGFPATDSKESLPRLLSVIMLAAICCGVWVLKMYKNVDSKAQK